MRRQLLCVTTAAILAAPSHACGSGSSSASGDTATGTGETSGGTPDDTTTTSGSADSTGGGETTSSSDGSESSTGGESSTAADSTGTGGPVDVPTCEELAGVLQDYRDAHPGNGGMDWDINALSEAELAADPVAQALFMLCGADQRPVFPLLAWEYGGADHRWIDPEEGALLYCVYIPVDPATENWEYDEQAMNVTADVYVVCPEQNPCNAEVGADQVLQCNGDDTNMEIIVDIASWNDGHDAGLELSRASTDLRLVLEDGTKVPLWTDI
jgi:hypothetical protein